MRAPGLILGRSVRATSGGTMLETLMRLMLPMPAARSALSKALRGVPPSAWPAVAAAMVIVFLIRLLLLDLQSLVHRSASDFSSVTLLTRRPNAREKLASRRVFFLHSQKPDHKVGSVRAAVKFLRRVNRDAGGVAGEVR